MLAVIDFPLTLCKHTHAHTHTPRTPYVVISAAMDSPLNPAVLFDKDPENWR
jgi:hypothetical protein